MKNVKYVLNILYVKYRVNKKPHITVNSRYYILKNLTPRLALSYTNDLNMYRLIVKSGYCSTSRLQSSKGYILLSNNLTNILCLKRQKAGNDVP